MTITGHGSEATPALTSFLAALERERSASLALARAILEIGQALAETSRDVRLRRVASLSRELADHLNAIGPESCRELLQPLVSGIAENGRRIGDGMTARALSGLLELSAPSASAFCESLLDGLIEVTGARRGYVLFCTPESSEAEVVAARNVGSTNLSLAEHACSRTVLAEMLRSGKAVVLDDAGNDERFSGLTSVLTLRLRSVLAAPLLRDGQVVGGIYLEDDRAAGRFGPGEVEAVTAAARFATFCLHQGHLFPASLRREDRVFLDADRVFAGIVGRHESIVNVLDVVRRVADLPATVLIEGESGTGKDLIARALHFAGSRAEKPFVTVNCAAIPEGLLESELFGHEKGAFTGATSRTLGRAEVARGGTLFLDEVSEVPPPLQPKLLRFLQSGELQRLGGRAPVHVDVRIVAATSKDLKRLMEAGHFQDALYYRLSVIPLRLPPLRERRSDIPLLIAHLREKYGRLFARSVEIDEDVYTRLQSYDFPGNVRELENIIQRVIALSLTPAVRVGDLPREVLDKSRARPLLATGGPVGGRLTPARTLAEIHQRRGRVTTRLAEEERELVRQAVADADGNITLAAQRLGCHRVTLHRILARGSRSRE